MRQLLLLQGRLRQGRRQGQQQQQQQQHQWGRQLRQPEQELAPAQVDKASSGCGLVLWTAGSLVLSLSYRSSSRGSSSAGSGWGGRSSSRRQHK
jgi:hypothetical protein